MNQQPTERGQELVKQYEQAKLGMKAALTCGNTELYALRYSDKIKIAKSILTHIKSTNPNQYYNVLTKLNLKDLA